MELFLFFFILFFSLFTFWLTKLYPTDREDEKVMKIINVLCLVFPKTKKINFLHYFALNLICIFPLSFVFKSAFEIFFYASLISVLLALSIIDVKCHRLPNIILLPTTILSLIAVPFLGSFTDYLGGLYCFFFFLILALFRFGALGGGDIKLVFLLGILLGTKMAWLGICIGLIIGGLVLIHLYTNKFLNKKDAFPYGPFLICGFIVMLFLEPSLQTLIGGSI